MFTGSDFSGPIRFVVWAIVLAVLGSFFLGALIF